MQRTPRVVHGQTDHYGDMNQGSPLHRSNSMSPTRLSHLPNASMSPSGSLTARRESDHRRAQEAGISLLGLAFGSNTNHVSPMPSPISMVSPSHIQYTPSQSLTYEETTPLDGVDPQLFLEGVKEHAKYLGMDPQRDFELLWIARESLVAPVPSGWYQVMTKEGAPYYYNDSTGESRWEHPSDRDYMALFHEVKRMKNAGETIDIQRLKLEIQHRNAQSAWNEENSSYQITTDHEEYHGTDGWIPGQHTPREQRDDNYYGYDNASPIKDEIVGHETAHTQSTEHRLPADDEHRDLVESLYAELNECKRKLQLQREHQERVNALERQLSDIQANYESQVDLTKKANDSMKSTEGENQELKNQIQVSSKRIEEMDESTKQLRQQLELANGEVELSKSKGVQENIELRQQVATLTMRLKELENVSSTDDMEKKLKKEIKLKFQWEQKYKTLEEQHQALMIQVDNANRKHEMDRHASQGNLEKYQKEFESYQQKLEEELKTSQEKHQQANHTLQETLSIQHEEEMKEMEKKHANALKQMQNEWQEKENALKASLRVLEAESLTNSAVLTDAKGQLDTLKRELTEATARGNELDKKNQSISAKLDQLQKEYNTLNTSIMEELRKAKEKGIEEATMNLNDKIQAANNEKDQFAQLYAQEMKERRQLHNRIMEMAGNIRVFCRVRPISIIELKSDESTQIVSFRSNDNQILDLNLSEGQKHTFEFDFVFQPTSAQTDVFEQTKALVVSAMDGFNVCIFAYGQTGSGKTHTMEGPETDRGVNFRAMEELFRVRDERMVGGNFECDMKLSILEVYNETIVDLLDDSNGERKTLEVRMGKQGAFVENLMEVEVYSTSDVEDLMKLGHSHRSVGSHDVNEHSSRSHLVLSITITTIQKMDGKKTISKLHLIDLAGSERISKTAASGQRLKEAQHINRSLSALGDVIASLGGHSKHVPYRNSKLTFLLQESLSGNSKVLMFVNVSPVQWNAWESLCSLNFAQRCRNVSLGQAKPTNQTSIGSATSVPKPTKTSTKQTNLSASEKIRVSLAPKSPKKEN